jgi:uncharacterized protein (UPF0332 family)
LDEVELFIKESSERIINAKILFDNKRYNLCISEIYYSMFYAAKALLKFKNKKAKRHAGIMNLFSKEYVQTNEFSKDIAKLYFRSEKKRIDADYESIIQFNRKQAENSIEDGEIFLKECKKYISKHEKT